jgi:long-chain fatty acid transport protein
MNLRRYLGVALLAFGSFTTSAFGQSFYWNTTSAQSVALGGVYVPSSSDVLDAIAANPAGLTTLTRPTLNANVSLFFARGSFSNSVNSNAPMTTSPGAVPYGAFGMPIGHSRFSFGLGFTPELMAASDWKYVDAPGTLGVTYGLQEQKSAILAGRAAGGFGVRINSRLSIGATVGADYNSNTLHAPYIFQSQPVLKGTKTLLDLHTTGSGWNTSVGVLAVPTKKVQVGLAWKSRTVINSTGTATGDASALFTALGAGSAPSTFTYSAKVQNVLPQSLLASVAWYANPRWILAFQTNWVNWQNSFVTLPVTLTNGTNAVINSVAGSTSLVDGVPLNWKNQYSYHMGAERLVTESSSVRFGYAYANSPVPDSTLTPLTAAIMSNQISAGYVYRRGNSRIDAAYAFAFTANQSVQQSGLQAGEYNNSSVHVGTQTVTLGYTYVF